MGGTPGAPPPLGHCPCDVIHIFQGWNKIAERWNKIAKGWNKIAKGWNKIFGMGNWGGRTTPPPPRPPPPPLATGLYANCRSYSQVESVPVFSGPPDIYGVFTFVGIFTSNGLTHDLSSALKVHFGYTFGSSMRAAVFVFQGKLDTTERMDVTSSIDCETCIHFGAKLELLYWGELVGIRANGPSCRFTTNEWMYHSITGSKAGTVLMVWLPTLLLPVAIGFQHLPSEGIPPPRVRHLPGIFESRRYPKYVAALNSPRNNSMSDRRR